MITRWRAVRVAFGWCGLVCSDAGLVRSTLPLPDLDSAAEAAACGQQQRGPDSILDQAADLLKAYFSGVEVTFALPLAPRGMTAFGRRVLRACADIDYGLTSSYGEVALAVGAPRAARAVGQALARNPLPVIVPCHRVISASGDAGGFTGGIEWKLRLLELEGVLLTRPNGVDHRHEGGVSAAAESG